MQRGFDRYSIGCFGLTNASFAETVSLSGVVRDFSDAHVDFQNRTGVDAGAVELKLDEQGPYLSPPSGTLTVESGDSFLNGTEALMV